MTNPVAQQWSPNEGDWSDALVLLALGRAIAETHSRLLHEPVPPDLDQLLRQLEDIANTDVADDGAQNEQR